MNRILLTAVSSVALISSAAYADNSTDTVEAVTVTARDQAGLLERRPDATVFGIDKALIDTARQATFVSAETLQRYGVEGVNDLIVVSPGAFTDSYYGVAGALNLRGTLAETYFRGFKRIEDRGTYPTELGAADRVDIVRGPATPIYGPSKVGGFLNFTPKTAQGEHGFLTQPSADVTAEGGSYDHQRMTADLVTPMTLGAAQGGLFLYGEAQADHSYYSGIYPSHQLGQLSADFDLGSGWTTAFGGQVYHSDGAVQTPGWNRVTQSLIDSGQYQAGRNTYITDANHNGVLDHAEADRGVTSGTGLMTAYFGFTPSTDPRFQLNSGAASVNLSPRKVFVSSADFSRTDTNTFYADLAKRLGEGQSLKLQLFYDELSNQRFVSYGYPADYRANVLEARASWTLKRDLGELTTDTVAGAGVRFYSGTQKESYNGGYISLDRRDLSQGPSATDIFTSPFSDPSVKWETDVISHWRDAGAFALTDIGWRSFDLTVGGRYDDYDVVGRDDGSIVYGAVQGRSYQRKAGDFSYSVSLSWKSPFGLMPYVTTARTASLELGQAGGVAPQLISGGNWLTASTLGEAGVKLRLFKDVLTGSLGVYRQTRTQLNLGNSVVGTRAEGTELEIRYLATKNLSLTFSGNVQRTDVEGPDNSLIAVPPSAVGVSGVNGYGGTYIVYATSQLRPGNYDQSLIPHSVMSLYGVWTSDRQAWGRWGATLGTTHVSRMASILPGGFVLPDYATANGSTFIEHGSWRVSANIDNLTDERYFTPVADVYANVAVLPGVGRTWRITLRRSF